MGKFTSTPRRKYNNMMELIRLLMLPFVCFWAFGFPDKLQAVEAVSGFVVPTFYVCTGYCVLIEDREERIEKLKREIIRNAIFFLQLFVVYILVNVLNPLSRPQINLGMFRSKRMWFEFLIFDMWPLPIGNTIWFIQSLLFASIILFMLDKLGALKFYKIYLVVLMIFMVLTGELSGLIHFNFLGYGYIPGGTFTRALPYLLLGMLIREYYGKLKRVSPKIYIIGFVVGAGLVLGEIYLLYRLGCYNYQGHMMGYGVMAFSLCGFAIASELSKINWVTIHSRSFVKRIYALHNPVFYCLAAWIMIETPENFGDFLTLGGIIVFGVCLIISIVITIVKMLVKMIMLRIKGVPDEF